MKVRVVVSATCVMAAFTLAGCGGSTATPAERLKCDEYKAFSASRSLDGGGSPTPVEAAQAAAGGGFGVPIPSDGWVQLSGGTPSGTYLRSGNVQVTAVQLKDGSWAVIEGKACV
jgi:hypothetical protein